jgi:hypothetical protein
MTCYVHKQWSCRRRAVTILEVAIAGLLLLIITLSFILSILFANRAARISALQLAAAHVLQGQVERIRADIYDRVDLQHYPDIPANSPGGVFLDSERRVSATLNYDILTTFPVVSATDSSVTVGGIPTNAMRSGVFAQDELTSNLLVISQGKGMTQVGCIQSNTDHTINITTDRTGSTQQAWYIRPDASSVVQLNMGKVVTVRVGWNYGGRNYAQEMRTLVVLPMDL